MRLDTSLSCAGLPAIRLVASDGTPTPTPAITTPFVSTPESLSGDTRPTYSIDFVDAYPGGGGIGDTLEGRWGTSLTAMTAMTPEIVTIDEGIFIDGDDPFPNLGTFSEAQALGTTIYFSFRVVRGADESDWSNTGTLLLVDGTMDAPGLVDLTDQATSTRVWSASFSVSGLAVGAYARLTGTGPIRVGGVTVYEAGEQVQVQNAASLELGVDTDAGSAITVDNVVSNRGVALETFSATTAGASPLPQPGSLGLFLRADDLATLFQSNAGTTAVAADGDPVGFWGDLSGAGFDLSSVADDTTRPTYHTSGGLHWVEFDGVNDVLRRLAGLGLWAAGSYTAMIAMRSVVETTTKHLLSAGTSAELNSILQVIGTSTTASAQGNFYRNDASSSLIVNSVNTYPAAHDDTDRVLTVIDDGGGVTAYLDGTAGTRATYTRAGNTIGENRLGLGALVRSSINSWFPARVYGLAIWLGTQLDATDRAAALAFFGNLQGRSL